MTPPLTIRTLLAGCACACMLAAGCGGSSTKTVSVAGPPPVTGSNATTQSTSSTATSTNATGGTAAGTSTPSTTRTATEPAFAEKETGASDSTAAAAVVRAHGYTPNDTAQYRPDQTLRVLVGTHTGSGDGYGQQAFFFVQGHYIGTDASAPSAMLKVVSQSDTSVTLAYPLYRHNDALCCPSGGQAEVRFELNNGRLSAASPIPPASSRTGLSRY